MWWLIFYVSEISGSASAMNRYDSLHLIAGSPRSCLVLKLALRRRNTLRGILRGIEVCHIYVNEQYGSNILGGAEKY